MNTSNIPYNYLNSASLLLLPETMSRDYHFLGASLRLVLCAQPPPLAFSLAPVSEALPQHYILEATTELCRGSCSFEH